MTIYTTKTGLLQANGTQLYHEVRGTGPVMLFIAGATGDAGHFERVAEDLANEFTVVTYDRRGNSRSPRPAGWNTTSTEEQADDAAALLTALGLTPALIVGASAGAIIALDLALRYPQMIRGAILHEPPMMSVMSHPEEVMRVLQPIIERGMQTGGPRGAVEAFIRFVAGDAVFERLDPQLRERMLSNGETLFTIEFGKFEDYRPDDASLAAVRRPVQIMVGSESAPFFAEPTQWLATRLGVKPTILPGGHAPYFDRPRSVAETIRSVLKQMS